MINAPPGVQANVTVTFVLFQPAALGAGEVVAAIAGGPGEVTVTLVEKVSPFIVAVTLVLPLPDVVARPPPVIVTMLEFADAQIAEAVTSRVVPSENLPIAVNCWFAPDGSTGLCGLRVAPKSSGAGTMRLTVALMLPELAVIVVEPGATEVASPVEPIVATDGADELQDTVVVRSSVPPSARMPMACN